MTTHRMIVAGTVLLAASLAWAAQDIVLPQDPPLPTPPPMVGENPCSTGETPCNPEKPWLRGTIEKFCGQDPKMVQRMRDAQPGKIIFLCECEHRCDPSTLNPNRVETGGLVWDGRCQARCNPNNCTCPDPCDG